MTQEEKIHLSKFLSLVLRHKPDIIGLSLDLNGWARVYDLILRANGHDSTLHLDYDKLRIVVKNDDKQRFTFNLDGSKIRANQGHSISEIDLEFEEIEPPVILFHGTTKRNIDGIKQHGLLKMNRQYVHLTTQHDIAVSVGKRYGEFVVLIVSAQAMWEQGHKFYLSVNNVWLTNRVPEKFILW